MVQIEKIAALLQSRNEDDIRLGYELLKKNHLGPWNWNDVLKPFGIQLELSNHNSVWVRYFNNKTGRLLTQVLLPTEDNKIP